MYKLLVGLMLLSLFIGCSSKEEQVLIKSYHAKTQYHKYLQQTEKTEIFDADTSIATFTATYMYTPNFEKNDTRDEVFIVGVHFDDSDIYRMNFIQNSILDIDSNKTMTSKSEFIVTLNHAIATKVTALDIKDTRLSGISFVTEWSDYYEVKFPHTGKKLKLIFENSVYGKGELDFSKVAKFVYTKKGF